MRLIKGNVMKFILLMLLSSTAFSQALISNRIPDNTDPAEPPGYVYSDTTLYSNSYFFEIGFRIDSTKFSSSESSSCNGWIPEGYWLYDRHPNSNNGRWMIGVGGNQRLCFQDQPQYSWGFGQFSLQFDTELDTCHMLTATRSQGGLLTVTLDGVTQTVNEWSGSVSYRGGNNGIGIGREVNGFDYWAGADSFPGEVYYLNDNGNVLTFQSNQVTGNASIGASVCTGAPPPPPPPPMTECEIDPNSVECACETTPHPACTACLAP
jgi:hypothetical protein